MGKRGNTVTCERRGKSMRGRKIRDSHTVRVGRFVATVVDCLVYTVVYTVYNCVPSEFIGWVVGGRGERMRTVWHTWWKLNSQSLYTPGFVNYICKIWFIEWCAAEILLKMMKPPSPLLPPPPHSPTPPYKLARARVFYKHQGPVHVQHPTHTGPSCL